MVRNTVAALTIIVLLLLIPNSAFAKEIIIPRTETAPHCPLSKQETLLCSGSPLDCAKGVSVKLPQKAVAPIKTTNASFEIPQNSLNPDTILELINTHRSTIGKIPYKKSEKLCALAQERAQELPGEAASGNYHAGLYARNLPYLVTENMKYGTDEQGAFDWWMTSYIHRKAIEGNFKYSCGICVGDICAQLFSME